MIYHTFKSLYGCLFFLLILGFSSLRAQPVLDARNISLGGGGTAYLSGVESNFYNPANLAIYDRKGTFHLSVGTLGSFFEPVLSSDRPQSQLDRYADTFLPYEPGEQNITSEQRNIILDENYAGNDLTSEHLARADILWGGIQWKQDEKAYSLVLRTRGGSRIDVGRGWYSLDPIEKGENRIRDFSLVKQLQVLHEISFGFAQEFKFINGLMPGINKLFVGIAPKFVIGGAYENTFYNGRYVTSSESNETRYTRAFTFHSSGSYSDMINSYRASRDPQDAIDSELDNKFLLNPTGYGAGIDFGLTYIIPLGSDVTLLDKGKNKRPVGKSLRIGLSVTDIGVVHYSSSPLQITSGQITSQVDRQEPLNNRFVGSAGQLPVFFEEAEELPNPFFEAESRSEEPFSSSLPTSINAGVILDINRLKVMSDFTLGLQNTAFTNKKLVARFGLESRALPWLPIRFGTTLATGKPVRFGAGTGIETRYWDFSIATQILVKSGMLTSDVVGGAIAALQFHL